jgi:hypothetical protein
MFCVLESLMLCSPAKFSLVGWPLKLLFRKYTTTAMNAVQYTTKEELMV